MGIIQMFLGMSGLSAFAVAGWKSGFTIPLKQTLSQFSMSFLKLFPGEGLGDARLGQIRCCMIFEKIGFLEVCGVQKLRSSAKCFATPYVI